ncbi:hypothetical protein [Streptomyces galbus]|uniref:hypothetical protein n=1 Tax=Streptomyces galbus TaxID=33898 RepID=UPI003EB8698F
MPGMVLLEAARQATTAHLGRPCLPAGITSHFTRYAELDTPCLITARTLPHHPAHPHRSSSPATRTTPRSSPPPSPPPDPTPTPRPPGGTGPPDQATPPDRAPWADDPAGQHTPPKAPAPHGRTGPGTPLRPAAAQETAAPPRRRKPGNTRQAPPGHPKTITTPSRPQRSQDPYSHGRLTVRPARPTSPVTGSGQAGTINRLPRTRRPAHQAGRHHVQHPNADHAAQEQPPPPGQPPPPPRWASTATTAREHEATQRQQTTGPHPQQPNPSGGGAQTVGTRRPDRLRPHRPAARGNNARRAGRLAAVTQDAPPATAACRLPTAAAQPA